MWSAWICNRRRGNEGFSLAEAAIALVIVATVIGAMVPSVLSMRAGEQARATRQNMETVMRASAAYVQANGCFPCPTPSDLLVEDEHGNFGFARGESAAACGDCPQAVGLVPFRSLGLPQSMARDGYGRYMTFAVDTVLARTNLIETTCKQGDDKLTPPACTEVEVAEHKRIKGLCQKNISTTTYLNIKQRIIDPSASTKAALLILSHGKNGRGAYRERGVGFRPALPVCVYADEKNFEQCNTNDDLEFVEAPLRTGSDPFDDQMLYFSRDALMTFAGGRACDTQWAGP
jgi:hypothetical protein